MADTHKVRLVELTPGAGRRWQCHKCLLGWNSNLSQDVIEAQPCDADLLANEWDEDTEAIALLSAADRLRNSMDGFGPAYPGERSHG